MPIDAARVARDFHRSADMYEKEAQLQFQIMSQLCELLVPYTKKYARVLDVGCGTGWITDALAANGAQWNIYGIDIAEAMCIKAHQRGIKIVRANTESLPFSDAYFDALFSSLCVQWLKEPRRFIQECSRTLKPGGRLAIATLGQRTLTELRDTFSTFGHETRVMRFRSAFDWVDMASSEGLILRHMHSAVWKQPYRSMLHLCQSLRTIGAMNKREDRVRHFTGASVFERARTHYESTYARPHGTHDGKLFGGGVWATWEPLMLMFEKPQH